MHDDIRRVFDLQREQSLRLRTSTLQQRLQKLDTLRRAVREHRQAIIEAGAADFGKPASEVELAEILPVLTEIADTRKHLKRWMKPRSVRTPATMFGTAGQIRAEPRGRCLIISPWNYPLTLTLGPLVPALAAGNTVIIKTSELTPHLSALLVKIVRTCFDEADVAIFEGEAEVATALLELPFDHVFFTGSPAIGKVVMAAAAKHLATVTLELGGKSPTIVDASADLELAAATIVWGKFTNNGQTCIAPDHIYVHASVQERFTRLLQREIVRAYGEGGDLRKAPLARMVNQRHTQRIAGLLDDARERGARIVHGGDVDAEARFVAPTLLADVPEDATIMQEEIFGPLLPIIAFDDIDSVIARINAAPKPLALYIWSRDNPQIEIIISRTSAGGTCINHVIVHFLHHGLPFGGVNNSGIGSYHGEYGFKAFSHERAVLRTHVMTARMFFLPHGAWKRRAIDWLLRFS